MCQKISFLPLKGTIVNGKNQDSVRAKKKTGADLGGVQGEHTPLPRDDIQLSNITGILQSVMLFLSKKNTGSPRL